MSRVHYFQRYSQKENVHTNNTLLLFKRIQIEDLELFQDVLQFLLGEEAPRVGVSIGQQEKESHSTPDGKFSQQSFVFFIEAKRDQAFRRDQVENHAKGLEKYFADSKAILLLSPRPLIDFPRLKTSTSVLHRTYADIIDACTEAGVERHHVLGEILDDFRRYCREQNLIDVTDDWLFIGGARYSHEDNVRWRVYYHPLAMDYPKPNYLGLYWDKAVRQLAQVEAVVWARYEGDSIRIEGQPGITGQQRKRIKDSIDSAVSRGWNNVKRGHAFFLTTAFASTTFRKTSARGMRGTRNLDLRNYLGVQESEPLPPLSLIAQHLTQKTWE